MVIACVAPGIAARGEEVPLKFERIDLSDGRVLKNVVIKSYDAKTEKLLLIADGKAMTIPIALVPPPFDRHLKRAPASGSWVSSTPSAVRPIASAADQYSLDRSVVVPRPPRQMAGAADQYQSEAPGPARSPKTKADLALESNRRNQAATSSAPPVIHVRPSVPQPAPAALAGATIAQHAAAAQQRAKNYFRYEFPIGSGSIKVTVLDFEWSPPKAVPGWEGRFETQGKAYLEFFDSKGYSFQRATRSFEVVTEQKAREDMTVIDLRLKN